MILLVILRNAKLNYRKSSINPPRGAYLISRGFIYFKLIWGVGGGGLDRDGVLIWERGGLIWLIKDHGISCPLKKLEYKVEKVEDHAAEDQNQIQNSSCK